MNEPQSTSFDTSPRVLLVDDDASMLRLLTLRLESEGYDVVNAMSGEEALSMLSHGDIDVVISDLRMPGMDGLALFEEIVVRHSGLPMILMTAHGSIEEAIVATQRGVMGFLTKPIDHQQLNSALQKAVSQSRHTVPDDWCGEIATRNPDLKSLLDTAFRLSKRDVSVLLSGPSGSGKEVLANAMHKASHRGNGPFIAINCGALPENLLESELFGHTKGAFTGALHANPGLFREADGGTLFLDEIGEMPVSLQVKLLRTLQDQKIRPVGSSKHYDVNVRIISATNRDLNKAMQEGMFREDLYYRINVVNLVLPSLTERKEDIPLLAKRFLSASAKRLHVDCKGFSEDAMQRLFQAQWPGNVRQLLNVVEQCVALTQTPIIPEFLVQQALAENASVWPSLTKARDDFEHQYLRKLLKVTEGNVTRAAELAGRNRTDLHKLMKKHHLEAAAFRAVSEESSE